MGTNYELGRDFEYKVRDRLLGCGYFVVRSAGSKGAADLVAGKSGNTLLVQCTTNKESKNDKDRSRLIEAAEIFGALPVMVWQDVPRGPLIWEFL